MKLRLNGYNCYGVLSFKNRLRILKLFFGSNFQNEELSYWCKVHKVWDARPKISSSALGTE